MKERIKQTTLTILIISCLIMITFTGNNAMSENSVSENRYDWFLFTVTDKNYNKRDYCMYKIYRESGTNRQYFNPDNEQNVWVNDIEDAKIYETDSEGIIKFYTDKLRNGDYYLTEIHASFGQPLLDEPIPFSIRHKTLPYTISIIHTDDLPFLSDEELQTYISDLTNQLADANIELDNRNISSINSSDSGPWVISSLFRDEELALYIRDALTKFSIEQTITREELDSIISLDVSDKKIKDLSGIRHLRNLKKIDISSNHEIQILPEELCKLENLEEIDIHDTDIALLPENIGELNMLKTINAKGSNIKSLPDSICECEALQSIDLSSTNLESLPENFGNISSLKKLYISDTPITALPESIWNLQLEDLDMSGTSIK